MSGYTPVFDSVFKGSLYGKWPDTAAWICLLALADWRGHIDMTPEYIAGITGMPLADLLGCIERFMQPDERSRSQVEAGRKLVLIDPSRSWGWKVVNLVAYRERAREMNRTENGYAAEKQRRYRERKRDQTLPDVTQNTPTQTHTQTHTQTEEKKSARVRELPTPSLPAELDLQAWMRWLQYRKDIGKTIRFPSLEAAAKRLVEFGEEQAAVVEQSIANSWRGLFALKTESAPVGLASRKTRYDQSREALERATAED